MKITKYFVQAKEGKRDTIVPHDRKTGAYEFLSKDTANEFLNVLIKANPQTSFRICTTETTIKHGIWSIIKPIK
jgi:hypothetical protein